MKKQWNIQLTSGNGSFNNPYKLKEKGYDIEPMVVGSSTANNQTLRQYIKRFNRDKIIFLVGRYEIHIYRDRACHNLLGEDKWTEIPMNYEIYVNDTNRFIQITTPPKDKGDQLDIILEYAGSLML
jgi:hypothetical protein